MITDSAHGKAKIIDITPGPDRERHHGRRDRDRRRLPGRLPGHQGHHHARPRRLRHHRGRARGGARRRGVRDLLRRRRRLHRRPADRPDRPQARPRLHRGDAGDGRLRRQDPAPALRRVRPPLRHARPRALLLQPEGRHLDHPRQPAGRRDGTGHHRRRRPRPQRGQDHRRRRARQGRRGGPDLRGARRRPRSTSTWSCRTSRPPRPASPTSPSRCRAPTARPRWARWPGSRTRSATTSCSTTTRSARCR